jgi:hypothetical protein
MLVIPEQTYCDNCGRSIYVTTELTNQLSCAHGVIHLKTECYKVKFTYVKQVPQTLDGFSLFGKPEVLFVYLLLSFVSCAFL